MTEIEKILPPIRYGLEIYYKDTKRDPHRINFDDIVKITHHKIPGFISALDPEGFWHHYDISEISHMHYADVLADFNYWG